MFKGTCLKDSMTLLSEKFHAIGRVHDGKSAATNVYVKSTGTPNQLSKRIKSMTDQYSASTAAAQGQAPIKCRAVLAHHS